MPSQDLIDAINAGSVGLIQQLITHLPAEDREGTLSQAFLRAAYEGRSASLNALLTVGVSPVVQDKLGRTALHWAAKQGHETVVRTLVEGGASVGVPTNDGSTPLHVAAEQNAGSIVRLLLRHRADPTTLTTDRRTPLHFAAEAGAAVTAAVLIDANVKVADEAGQKHSMLEIESDRRETPLARAAARGRASVVQLLVRGRADIGHKNFWGQGPLQLSAHGGHVGCAAVLLEAGAAVDAAAQDGTTPLHTACERGHPQVVELLLSHSATVSNVAVGGRTPLHAAADRGCAEAIEALLAHNADPEAKTDEQRTALAQAASRGHTLAVLRLLDIGYADLDALDVVKQTPAHAAAAAGKAEVLEVLADKRARIEDADMSGRTPLILALSARQNEAVKVLIKKGAALPDEWRERPGIAELLEEIEAELIREQLEAAARGAYDPKVIRAAEKEFEDARQKLLGMAVSMSAGATAFALQHAEAELKDAQKLAKDLMHAEECCHFEMETLTIENSKLAEQIEENKQRIVRLLQLISDLEELVPKRIAAREALDASLVENRKTLDKAIARNLKLAKELEDAPKAETTALEQKAAKLKEEQERMQAEIDRIHAELARWHAEREKAAYLQRKAHALLQRDGVDINDSRPYTGLVGSSDGASVVREGDAADPADAVADGAIADVTA